ncbi:hypothetical protein ABMA27_013055 [Loxostege sticticalis]|uniref:Androgen-dependent TFPI-regulating protein n=1 Tax=Loxostege sticticalis TaxID=481309 RepID=A0ABR3IDX5_LOXSC
MIRAILHGTAVAVNTYTLVYDQLYMELPFPAEGYKELPLRARYAFVTYWCLALQTVYFSLSLLNDFFGTNDASPRKKPLIRTIKDLLFSLAFPVALFVTISFWTIYFYRKELVAPDHIERLVPIWVNMVLHVTNTLFISAEILVSRITYPERPIGLAFVIVFNIAYLFCLVKIKLLTGTWIYPLLVILDVPTTVVFFAVGFLICLSFYFLGEMLCSAPNVQVNGYHGNLKKKY